MKTECNELYILECYSCHMMFKADNPKEHLCPDCIKHSQPRKPSRKKKAIKKKLTLAEILHIAKVYNIVNRKYLHYGELVVLVEQSAGRCVCCGEPISEGMHICAKCEKAVE